MKSIFDTKISYYRNVEDNVGTEISLRDFLFNDQYKEQIEYWQPSQAHLLLHVKRKTS